MTTPICDYVNRYSEKEPLRLHIPGHKGKGVLGLEHLDITEIKGADSLYEADGIIRQSEENASALFGCPTFYSTEGSSQCIKAMLFLALMHIKKNGKKPLIAAGRNAHKSFISAAALLDFEVEWLYPENQDSYMSCQITAADLERTFCSENKPTAVYLTSPDYLGNVADIKSLADVCHRYGALLLVDNAHGAYMKFLPESQHPIDLGADLCCDSAHKTLPVLTGGAYLHTSDCKLFSEQAKNALALFGSTSPSYLILQSLDMANVYLSENYCQRLEEFLSKVQELKQTLFDYGYELYGSEPLKLTVYAKSFGYEGVQLSDYLEQKGIVCEFSDADFVVMMLTPEIGNEGLQKLEKALLSLPKRPAITVKAPIIPRCERVMSIRQATFSPCHSVPVSQSVGKVLAYSSVGCPPAVSIVASGERIPRSAVECFNYYGIKTCTVVDELNKCIRKEV